MLTWTIIGGCAICAAFLCLWLENGRIQADLADLMKAHRTTVERVKKLESRADRHAGVLAEQRGELAKHSGTIASVCDLQREDHRALRTLETEGRRSLTAALDPRSN